MYTIQKIHQEVLMALKSAIGKQYAPAIDEFETPPDIKLGDIAFPCFGLARGMGKPPSEISAELAQKIEPKGLISKVEAHGPYINFFLDVNTVGQETLKEILEQGEKYGAHETGKGKKVMVEYAQVNTHKAVHVGHVRNIVLGRTVSALLERIGYTVICSSYHGDVGTHVATTLWGLIKFHKDEKPPKIKRAIWLGGIYAEAVEQMENEDCREEVKELNRKLAAGDSKLRSVWKKTRTWSIKEFTEVFEELGARIDKKYFESEMDDPGRKIVAELIRLGIAKESEGAIVVPLEEFGLETFLVLKSDGTTLYATRDLALASLKFKNFDIDRSLHVVDMRQTLYFKQLGKTLELLGFDRPFIHIPYEFVKLPGGAMSSRKGDVVTYDELREAVFEKTYKETKKRHEDWSEKKIKETTRQISFAGINFGMLAPDVSRVISFDIENSISFDGFTGPYIQYTGARISSILKKASYKVSKEIEFKTEEPAERKIMMLLAQFPQVVLSSAERMRPAPLAAYLFDLAKAFSEFYENIPVLKAQESLRKSRLDLIYSVRIVLENGSRLLGFEIPDKM